MGSDAWTPTLSLPFSAHLESSPAPAAQDARLPRPAPPYAIFRHLPPSSAISQVGDRIQVQWLLQGGAKAWFGGSVAGHRHSAHGASRPFIAYDDGLNQEHSPSQPKPEPECLPPTPTPTPTRTRTPTPYPYLLAPSP